MRNRILALMLCVAMMLVLVCGCGSSKTTDEPETAETETEVAEVEETESTETDTEVVEGNTNDIISTETVEYVGEEIALPLTEEAYTFTAWLPDMPFLYAYVDDWMSNNYSMISMSEMTNVYFDFEYASDPTTSMSLIAASGEYPDVMFSAASYYAGGVSRAIEEGVILAIEDYIAEKIPNLNAILEADPAIRREMTTTDGHIGTIYSIYDENGGGSPVSALVRGDWLDSLGMAVEDFVTYDDYHDYLAAAKTMYGAQLYMPYSGGVSYNSLSSGYGVASQFSTAVNSYPFYQVNGEVKFGVMEPEYKEYIQMLAEWYSEGLIHDDFLTFTTLSRPTADPIVQNEVSMVHWNAANASDVLVQMDEGASLVGVQNPVLAGNEGELDHFGMISTRCFMGFCISTTNSNLDLFFQWCNFGYTEKGSMAFNWGKEGVTYELDENGDPHFTDFILNSDTGMGFSLAQMCMLQDAGPFVVDTFKKYDYYEDYVVAAYRLILDRTDWDNTYFLPSTMSLSNDDATNFSTIMGDIGTYIDEHITQYIMGIESFDTWDDFLAQIETLGIDECLEMYQNAYNTYMSH